MQCPNCGQETVNINGRNVCLDCGIEVSSESNLGQDSQSIPPTVTPETEQVQSDITEETVAPISPAESIPSQQVPSPMAPPVPMVPEPTLEPTPAVQAIEPQAAVSEEADQKSQNNNEVTPEPAVSSAVSELVTTNATELEANPKPSFSEEYIDSPAVQTLEPTISDIAASNVQVTDPTPTAPISDETVIPVQAENPFEHDIPVDSGRPLYEEPNEQNSNVSQSIETPTSFMPANSIDTVTPTNPNEGITNSSLTKDLSSSQGLNVFQEYSEQSQEEFMQASPITNGTIKKVIIVTTVFFVSFLLILIIFLKKDSVLSLFGVQNIKELDSPEKQPFDEKGDGQNAGKVQ